MPEENEVQEEERPLYIVENEAHAARDAELLNKQTEVSAKADAFWSGEDEDEEDSE